MTPPVGKSGPGAISTRLSMGAVGWFVRGRGGVGEQVREGRGEDDGLLVLAVEGRTENHRLLVDAVEEIDGGPGQARLGVAVGRRVVAVNVAEVALTVDERIALRK